MIRCVFSCPVHHLTRIPGHPFPHKGTPSRMRRSTADFFCFGSSNMSHSKPRGWRRHGILVRDAVEVYQHTGEELPDTELGDALIVLPSHVGNLNGIAAVESTTVRISGEAVVELAHELRKHPGHDITLEAEA